ncbi:hypothetical protein BU23DRAFT_571254 [Bimuria novae-zelandiae CBS 107.79]|uniref:Uncharacterized protein n=1 Tax=Bimuria novae-zelandiae CBS 107.79 TaxID=1447943 RepID=A0A6A5V0I1_9PLEO|nr:hypothetical protein BU23DRAFT_571254 [Bimuria novae-zelandiae CBS 107.79]
MLHQLLAEDGDNDRNHNKMRSLRSIQSPLKSSKAVLFTTWENYNTEEKVKASPYYTVAQLPSSGDHNAVELHAVHPVPNRYLRTLAPEQLENLKIQLTTNVNYETEMKDRVDYTVDAINEVLGDDDFLEEQMRRSLHNWTVR